jgi:hypothetical protein
VPRINTRGASLPNPPCVFKTWHINTFPILLIISEIFTSLWRLIRAVIAQLGYRLDDRGSRVRFPVGAENFSLHHRVQNGSEANSAPYPIGNRGTLSLGVKRTRREADHSPHLVPRSKNAWSYTSTPQYVFMAWCSVKHFTLLYFTFTKTDWTSKVTWP